MAEYLNLRIITPSGVVHESPEVLELKGWGLEGELAVLPGHTTFLTPLRIAELSVRQAGRRRETELVWAVAGGILEVARDGALIISAAVEGPDEIDVERAKRAGERARKRLEKKEEGTDPERARDALKRAEIRLKVAAYNESELASER